MYRSIVFGILCALIVGGTVSCSKDENGNPSPRSRKQPLPKVPDGVPTDGNPKNPQISVEVTRTLVQNVSLDSALETEWNNRDYDSSANCIQLVNYKKGTENLGNFLEFTSQYCPSTGVNPKERIGMSLPVTMIYPDVYAVKDNAGHDTTIGTFRSSDSKLITLCDTSEDLCMVRIEYSMFAGIELYL